MAETEKETKGIFETCRHCSLHFELDENVKFSYNAKTKRLLLKEIKLSKDEKGQSITFANVNEYSVKNSNNGISLVMKINAEDFHASDDIKEKSIYKFCFPNEYVELNTLNQGDTFSFGGYEWIVLDRNEMSNGTLCLMKDCFSDKLPFDKKGNLEWRYSTLRHTLEYKYHFYYDYINNIVLPFINDDKLDTLDYVSALSLNKHKKYRKFIPTTKDCYWLSTSWESDGGGAVYYIDEFGCLSYNVPECDSISVRPYVYFNSAVMVNKKSEFTEEDNGDNINE